MMKEREYHPFFSVIIPVYNCEEYIEQCLESLIKQTFCLFEVIIVDDGSTDHTFRICKEYEARDRRFHIFQQRNSGPNMARKTGLSHAAGRYTVFMDGDDWIETRALEHYFGVLKESEYDSLVLDFYQNFETYEVVLNNNIIPGEYKGHDMELLLSKMICGEKYYKVGIWPSMWSKVFKTDKAKYIINKVDDRLTFGEDAAFTYLFIANACSVYVLSEAFYHYRDVKKSLSKRVDSKYWDKIRILFKWFDDNMNMIPGNQVQNYKLQVLELSIESVLFQNGSMYSNVKKIQNILRNEAFRKLVQEANTQNMEKKSKSLFCFLKSNKYFCLYFLYLSRRYWSIIKNAIKGSSHE